MDDPDQVQWQNLSTSPTVRNLRKYIIWILALFLLIFCLLATVVLKEKAQEIKQNQTTACPSDLTKYDAWFDATKPKDVQYGLMSCYCKKAY